MKLNHITLRKADDTFLTFYPLDIENIKIYSNRIILFIWDRENLTPIKKIILYKNNYDYPHWYYFIIQLKTFFEI